MGQMNWVLFGFYGFLLLMGWKMLLQSFTEHDIIFLFVGGLQIMFASIGMVVHVIAMKFSKRKKNESSLE